jgi:uncharacterized membrane protein
MKTFDIKKKWIIWIIILIPFIYSAFIYNQLPEQVPIHWDLEGRPDDYSSRFSGVFLMPLMNIGVYFLLLLLPKIDPRKRNYELFSGTYRALRFIIHSLFTAFYFLMIQGAMTGEIFSPKIIFITIFLFLALMGNYMKNIKSNFFIGIRTPWTLDNKEVWKKTHELAGKIWFYTGLLAALLVLLIPEKFILYLSIPVFAIIVLIPVVYSYFAFREIEKQNVQEE